MQLANDQRQAVPAGGAIVGDAPTTGRGGEEDGRPRGRFQALWQVKAGGVAHEAGDVVRRVLEQEGNKKPPDAPRRSRNEYALCR